MQISPIENQQNFHVHLDPYSKFIYAIESPETKKRYPQRFKTFLDYLRIPGDTIEDRINIFYENAIQNTDWPQNSLINFIMLQKERVLRDDISASTIPNYYKPVKLFCDMNNILLN